MTAYYNENNPKNAATLRELITAGHIAPGIVDERSIEDVFPSDLRGFAQCHFFAGIGVWSYALRSAGWSDDRPVWTGSCPCQPFSAAGEGAGFDDERHLWPHWEHLIRECRPAGILGEQVASKNADPWVDLVCDDLEALGYAFGAVPFPSAGVGAPHIRDRTYWVANGQSSRRRQEHAHLGGRSLRDRAQGRPAGLVHGGGAGGMGHADRKRAGRHGRSVLGPMRGEDGQHVPVDADASGGVGGMEYAGCHHDAGQVQTAGAGQPQGYRPADQPGGSGVPLSRLVYADGGHAGAERQQRGRQQRQQPQDGGRRGMAPGATFDAATGAGPTNGLWAAADWLLCRDEKWRPVEPGTFPLAHGAPERLGRLHGYGNAINAEAARVFIETVMEAMTPPHVKGRQE